MDDDQILAPQATKEIEFYGDMLQIAIVDGVAYIALRPLTDHLGLDWAAQRQRTLRDEVLVEEARQVLMTGSDGKQRQMFALPLEYLPGWLFGITPSRVRPELMEKLKRYRKDCFRVLWNAFQSESKAVATVEASGSNTLLQVRNLGLAVAQLAEQQMELQDYVSAVDTRINVAELAVHDLQQRLTTVEQRVEPRACITEEQAADIANKVRALAEALDKRDTSKNHYQSIFAELYRRFRVSSYKLITIGQYQKVLTFLDEWADSLDIPKKPTQEKLF